MSKLLKVVSITSVVALASSSAFAGGRGGIGVSADVSVGGTSAGADVGVGGSGIGADAGASAGSVGAEAGVGVGGGGATASASVGVGGTTTGSPPGTTPGTAVPGASVPNTTLATAPTAPVVNLQHLLGMAVVSSDRKMLGTLSSIERGGDGYRMRIRVADSVRSDHSHVIIRSADMPKVGDVIRLPISLRSFVSQI